MAEAVLTLDNADGWLPIDFAEVSIGRRAYRSGDSEYLINGARARLRDVVELLGEGRLGANELVVVGQGTVDAALSLRPEERRQLFEEAAGVKGLQVRRNEASGRLDKALDNLTRVSDLIGELKPQVRRLALQAEHQQQHDALGVAGSRARRWRRIDVASRPHGRPSARPAAGPRPPRPRSRRFRRRRTPAARRSPPPRRATGRPRRRRGLPATAGEEAREALIRPRAGRGGRAARHAEHADRAGARRTRARRAAQRSVASIDGRQAADGVDPGPGRRRRGRAAPGGRPSRTVADADEALVAAEQAVAEARARESDRIAAARARRRGRSAPARPSASTPNASEPRPQAALDEARAAPSAAAPAARQASVARSRGARPRCEAAVAETRRGPGGRRCARGGRRRARGAAAGDASRAGGPRGAA